MTATPESRSSKFFYRLAVFYWALAIVISVLWLIAIGNRGPGDGHVPPGSYFFPIIAHLWDASSDPIFTFFLHAIIVIVAIALIPGVIVVTLGFLFLLLAVGILIGAFYLLYLLATVSLGGFLLVMFAVTSLAWLIKKKYPEDVAAAREKFHWILDWFVAAFMKIRSPVEYEIREDDIVPINSSRSLTVMDDEERGLKNQIAKVANMLSIGKVPVHLEEYDGWFQEAFKRVHMRSAQRTNSEALVLLQQATAAHTELLKLRRAQGELGRLEKENRVKDLELDAQEQDLQRRLAKENRVKDLELDAQAADLQLRIKQSKKAIKDLNKPPSPKPTHDVDAGDVD